MFKHKKLLLIASCALLLTSCGEIIATPDGYDNNKLVSNIGEDDKNNMEKIIYDALHDSADANSIVVDIVFNKIFDYTFGTYQEIEKAVSSNSFNEIVNKYSVYQDKNRTDGQNASTLEIARVKRVYNRMQQEISDTLWENISSTNYQNSDGLFDERLFALNVYQSLYSLDPTTSGTTWDEFTSKNSFYEPILLLPDTKLFDPETLTWSDQNIIHIQNTNKLADQNDYGYYKEYIEKEILSDVKQHILTEDYLYNNEYQTLGTRYARQIEYVAIADNANYPGAARKLCTTFIDNNILNATDPSKADLSILANAWKGYDLGEEEKALLEASGLTYQELAIDELSGSEYVNFQGLNEDERDSFIEKYAVPSKENPSKKVIAFYQGTDYADLALDFNKIKDNIALTDTSIESDFSGSNMHSYYNGFEDKIQEIEKSDYTTDGWGIKNESFSSLSGIADYGDRLWNIQVANGLIEENGNNYVYKTTIGNEDFFYLLPKTLPQGESYPFLYYNSGTYYIVQVKEAASTTRLSTADIEGSYTNLENDGGLKAENVAYEICNILANNTTNQTNALEYFLEKADLIYNDDSILSYFETTYPNLFED